MVIEFLFINNQSPANGIRKNNFIVSLFTLNMTNLVKDMKTCVLKLYNTGERI